MIAWLAAGGAAGCALSITPAMFLVPLLIVAIIAFIIAFRSPRYATRRLVRLMCPLAAVGVVLVAAWLPTKPLDRRIGPVHYPPMTISALAEALRRDHGLNIDVRRMADTSLMVALETDTAVAQGALLDRLGALTQHDWHWLTCPNGSTILWGSHPDVIIIRQWEEAQPSVGGDFGTRAERGLLIASTLTL